MKITEMYKNIDDNGTDQSYKNLKNFVNYNFDKNSCLLLILTIY